MAKIASKRERFTLFLPYILFIYFCSYICLEFGGWGLKKVPPKNANINKFWGGIGWVAKNLFMWFLGVILYVGEKNHINKIHRKSRDNPANILFIYVCVFFLHLLVSLPSNGFDFLFNAGFSYTAGAIHGRRSDHPKVLRKFRIVQDKISDCLPSGSPFSEPPPRTLFSNKTLLEACCCMTP